MSSAAEISVNQLTVEELAAQSGMTVRNIRAHQARGLLAPPEVRQRIGYYGPEHLAQLRLIRELQDEGFNLNGIKRLLEDTEGTAERLMRFRQALSDAATAERAETLTISELGRRFRVSAEEAPSVLARAVELGVLVPVSEDRYEVPSPSLLAVAEEAAVRGIPIRDALAVLEDIQRELDSVSKTFVQLFLETIWKPFASADMPAERWPEIEQAVQGLRPIASEGLMAIFQQRLGSQIDRAFAEITRRLAERAR